MAEHARIGALDGLRAVAVSAVVVYHLWPHALPSGYLGVDVFMVVSGFIVTNLLLRERDRSGRVRLGAFWGRRFRRLVPALMLLVVVVTWWVHVTGPATLVPSVREQGLAALFYVTNWKLVASGVSYGGMLGAHSPFVHLWSLAVEEQFYLCWPPLLVGLLALGRGRRRAPLIVVTALGAVTSAAWMAWLYDPGHDPFRLYYGTDTRAQAFLFGALAALVAPLLREHGTRVVRMLGPVALLGVLAMFTTDSPGVLYRGGFGLVALATAVVALATTLPGPVAFALDHAPLRALGRVSYGVYLWHWPAITLLTPARVGVHGLALTAVQLAVTATGTAVSWFAVERPLARARPIRVAVAGAFASAAALVALVVLPAGQTFAYANFRTERVLRSVVLAPPTTAATARPSSTTTATLPSRAGSLALPRTGTAMIVGDSGMFSGTPAFAAALQASGWRVIETAYPGIGLTTYPAQFRSQWTDDARKYHVDLTIAMLGDWDRDWIQQHGANAYRGAVDSAVGAFTSGGGKVLWLSVLPGEPVDERDALDRYFAELPHRYPGVVAYLDIQSVLRAPGGGWPRVVGRLVLRGRDGWHLCQDGAAAVARVALASVGLEPSGWEHGPWRLDPRYDIHGPSCRA